MRLYGKEDKQTQIQRYSVGVFHTLNNRKVCARALSRTTTIFCILPPFWDYAVVGAGKAQVRFAAQAQPGSGITALCLCFSYPTHLIYFECTLLEQSWLLHHKPGRALRSLLAPVGAHSGINRTLALELMLISTISGNASFPASKTKNEHLHSWKASIPFRSSSAHLLSLFCIEAVATLALRFLTDNPTLGMSRKANIFSFESSSFISFWLPFTINT